MVIVCQRVVCVVIDMASYYPQTGSQSKHDSHAQDDDLLSLWIPDVMRSFDIKYNPKPRDNQAQLITQPSRSNAAEHHS